MIPLEILITSICINVIYLIIKLIHSKDKYQKLYSKLIKSKSNLENSIREYKNQSSISNEMNDELDDIENFIDILEDLNTEIIFKNI